MKITTTDVVYTPKIGKHIVGNFDNFIYLKIRRLLETYSVSVIVFCKFILEITFTPTYETVTLSFCWKVSFHEKVSRTKCWEEMDVINRH